MTSDEAIARYAAQTAIDLREYMAAARGRDVTMSACEVCAKTMRGGGLCAACWERIAERMSPSPLAASTVAGIVIAEKAEPTEGTT